MTTAAELGELVGKLGRLTVNDDKLRVDVQIINAKMAYGTLRLEVVPAAGEGSAWVDASRVELAADPEPATELVRRS